MPRYGLMVANSVNGSTIRIFLADGKPQGLRVVDRPGWTGSCLAFARADYLAARLRPELRRTGVYLLVGPDANGEHDRKLYVGEGDDVRVRLDAHHKAKDFWTDAYVLTSSDLSLNKAHVRYLEARLIEIARDVDVTSLDNGTAPPTAHLDEPATADMEAFLGQCLPLFPLLGVTAFDVVDEAETSTKGLASSVADQAGGDPPDDVNPTLFLQIAGVNATGRDDSRGFLVHADSRGRLAKKTMAASYEQLRARLLKDGVLAQDGETLRLTKSYIFDSPSAAASVLAGASRNGRTVWKDASGRTLKELQEESVPAGPEEDA